MKLHKSNINHASLFKAYKCRQNNVRIYFESRQSPWLAKTTYFFWNVSLQSTSLS